MRASVDAHKIVFISEFPRLAKQTNYKEYIILYVYFSLCDAPIYKRENISTSELLYMRARQSLKHIYIKEEVKSDEAVNGRLRGMLIEHAVCVESHFVPLALL